MFVCVSINVWAQQTINLNRGKADFQSKKAAAPANIPQEYLEEAKVARVFAINPALQRAESVNVGDVVELQLFENSNYTATVSNIVTDVNGNFTLSLKLPEYPMGIAVITTNTEGKSFVNVSIPELNENFASRSSLYSDVSYLLEMDKSKVLKSENDAVEIPQSIMIPIEENVEGDIVKGKKKRALPAPTADGCLPSSSLSPTDPAQIDILIVYTPAAEAWANRMEGGITNTLAGAMAKTKAVIDNQGNGDKINLVYSQQVTYTENVSNMNLDLDRLTGTADGYMDEVHLLRKQYSADIVVLFALNDVIGGLGWVLMNDTDGDYSHAFNVVRIQQASGTTTSIHEIGHNMGMRHDAENNTGTPLYSYAFGWYWTGSDSKTYGSVMSYTGTETPYFSNPDANYMEQPTGTDTANNARTFRNTKHVVANYSNKLANLPDAPTNIVVSNPTNNGVTISWDAVANATSYKVGIYANGSSGGYYLLSAATNTLTFAYGDFHACTTYYFWVDALNDCEDVVSSPTLTFTTKCATDPTVTTQAATGITNTTATLNKTVTSNGATVTAQGFKYKKTSGTAWQTSLDGNLAGLTAATQYQFYAYATTASATFTGSTLDFTTTTPGTRTWNGTTNDWTVATNWTPAQVPTANDDVVIPKSASSNYPVVPTDGATIKNITIEPGAELGRQDLLSYQKAFVQYNFNGADSRGRWHMLSIPLQEAYPGDFTFGGYPSTWIRKFKTTTVGSTTNAGWETTYESNTPFSAGSGFIVWLDENDGTDNKGLQLSNGILELPYVDNDLVPVGVHYTHDYAAENSIFYNFKEVTGGGGYERTEDNYTVTRSVSAYKLTEASVDEPLDFGYDDTHSSNFALVGNPFMASLNFDMLQTASVNAGKIKSSYQIWTGKGEVAGYAGYIIGGSYFGLEPENEPLTEFIAPTQSFIVEEQLFAVGYNTTRSSNYTSNPVLTFDISMTEVGQTKLRNATTQPDKLDIVARNEVAAVRTFIAQREDGQTEFGGNDSRKLMNGISRVPEIYSLKPSGSNKVALGANFINTDNQLIPVGLATTYSGEITLAFTGMDTYQAKISLLDVLENKEIDLTGLGSYEYAFNYTSVKQNGQAIASEDRFFIRFSPTNLTGLSGLASAPVSVFDKGGVIHAVSGASNLIKEVFVYNLQGVLLQTNTVNTAYYTGNREWVSGVYVVKVVSEKGTQNVKLIIK
ncbi:hypothetical protein FACS1894160_3010 [Bacteroidia bacterium]|nr:hypothetical protein FACS1894160_3010 [Bacteroidia bacterium]